MSVLPISHLFVIGWGIIGNVASVAFHITMTIAAIVYIKKNFKK